MSLLTYTEVARELGVSNDTVRRLVARGELPVVRVTPSRPQIKLVDLERFVEERTVVLGHGASSVGAEIGRARTGRRATRRVSDFRARLRSA